MITYNYECDKGHQVLDCVKDRTKKRAHKKCPVCGKRALFTFKANTQSPGTYNYPSYAMAVHPSQVQEAIEFGKQHGVKTDFDSEGQPIIRDHGHFKKHMRIHGFHERNAFI